MAGVSYAAPWWVNLLHRLPHFDLRWEATSSQFRPEDTDYQQVTRAPGWGITSPGSWPLPRDWSLRISMWGRGLFLLGGPLWSAPGVNVEPPPPLEGVQSLRVTRASCLDWWSRLPPLMDPFGSYGFLPGSSPSFGRSAAPQQRAPASRGWNPGFRQKGIPRLFPQLGNPTARLLVGE